ncbi:MAG: ArsA-related P-loop ATPase [Myxococcota bacterium]|nr:ArsA-related P-loop ATPase [Myxococcota bacterium]
MSTAQHPSLLDRRLVIVSGKGGTGKTTVTAALALAAARAGRRVLAAEMDRDGALSRLLAPDSPPVGYEGLEVQPGLTIMRIDPYEALTEYLGLQIGIERLVRSVLRNRAFHQLMEASPGWRELITLGKVWHLEQMTLPDGSPRYDLLVVDAPATGHGVAFLNVPRVAASAVRAGPLRRNSQLVEGMIADPVRTVLLPVALAEELPTRETAELVRRVEDEVGIAIDRVVVNGVVPPPFPSGLEQLDEALGRLPRDLRCGDLPPAGTLHDCAAFLRARHELNRAYLDLLHELTGRDLLRLPYLAEGAGDPEALRLLGDALLEGEAESREGSTA